MRGFAWAVVLALLACVGCQQRFWRLVEIAGKLDSGVSGYHEAEEMSRRRRLAEEQMRQATALIDKHTVKQAATAPATQPASLPVVSPTKGP